MAHRETEIDTEASLNELLKKIDDVRIGKPVFRGSNHGQRATRKVWFPVL
jgi:hypothetical protein